MMRLTGRWRIVDMDTWDRNAIDLAGPGFIEFADDGTGQFGFVAARGWMDCRSAERDGKSFVEFTWGGDDEGDQVSGGGWGSLAQDGTLTGYLFIHRARQFGLPRDAVHPNQQGG
jgi:hypothetical protein